jgi:O-antigen/teichoic acid export membrane protein
MLWVALPLGLVTILVSVNGNVPRYVIQRYLGARELGIYSALGYLPQASFMVATALGGATFARLAKLFFVGDLSRYKLLLFKLMAICMGVGLAGLLGCVLFGRQALTILYKPEYAQHVELLIWLMVVGTMTCLAPSVGAALTATSQFRLQVPLFLAVTATSLVASIILVPQKGLEGAGLAALISIIVQLLLSAYVIHWAMRNRAHDLKCMSPRVVEPAFRDTTITQSVS